MEVEESNINDETAAVKIEIEVSPLDSIATYSMDSKHNSSDEDVYQETEDASDSRILRHYLEHTSKQSDKTQPVRRRIRKKLTKGRLKSSTPVIKNLKCPDCEKRFRYMSDLKRHAVCHSTEKPFDCLLCDKKFNRAFNLKEHIQTKHDGDKPHACITCDKKFSRYYDLKIHMFIHSGERPYKCTMCEKDFNNSSNLTKHIRLHYK